MNRQALWSLFRVFSFPHFYLLYFTSVYDLDEYSICRFLKSLQLRALLTIFLNWGGQRQRLLMSYKWFFQITDSLTFIINKKTCIKSCISGLCIVNIQWVFWFVSQLLFSLEFMVVFDDISIELVEAINYSDWEDVSEYEQTKEQGYVHNRWRFCEFFYWVLDKVVIGQLILHVRALRNRHKASWKNE